MIELTDHLVAGTSSLTLDANAYGNATPLRLLPFNSPAAHGLRVYADELGNARCANPRADLTSALVQAEVDGERLTDEEFSNFFRLLIFAGNETTRSAMSHGAIAFADHPDQWDRLTADAALLDSAVEPVRRVAPQVECTHGVSAQGSISG